MSDHDSAHADGHGNGHGHDHDAGRPYVVDRTTAPQGPYTTRTVAIGAAIAVIGLALTFGVPLAFG